MFFCCGKSAAKVEEPAAASDREIERRISAESIPQNGPSSVQVQHEKIEASQPPPATETMDYTRARREAEERELERVRSEISGLSMAREERDPRPLRLSLSCSGSGGGSSEKDGGFLGLPMSPGVSSPRLDQKKAEEEEDDWARAVMESVSRAGSTYEGDKSRPVTPSIHIEEPAPEVEKEKPQQQPTKAESLAPAPVVEEMKPQEKEAENNIEKHTSIYLSHDAAAVFMNYNHQDSVPAVPLPAPEPEKAVEEPAPKLEVAASALAPKAAPQEPELQRASLYITPDAAALFINFDASLAPPTPAASFCEGDAHLKRIPVAPPRCPSPAPSISISESEYDIRNSKRASTLSTISTIAQAAASAAIDRHTIAGKRMSNLSTYSTTSYYSTRPSSPAPPTSHRISQLRRSPSVASSRLSSSDGAAKESSDALLLPYLSPLTAQLLPKLDKLLSTTSILSAYSRWEMAMSLRREVRAFIASGIDEFLDDDGEIEQEAALKRAVDAFVARGRLVQDADDETEDTDDTAGSRSSKGFGDVRAFWGGRGSGAVF